MWWAKEPLMGFRIEGPWGKLKTLENYWIIIEMVLISLRWIDRANGWL